MACTFSGLTLKPSLVTMKPKNFPSSMPKEHFVGLSFKFTLRKESNVRWILLSIVSSSWLMMTRSSMYTSTVLPISPLKTVSIRR
ncbi:hypothetical protein Hanom_Chr17g01587701 [Helianthus anomalus]